jgi:hypothetical protein
MRLLSLAPVVLLACSGDAPEQVATPDAGEIAPPDDANQALAAAGCADGEREGLLAPPDIAACAGGFDVPGLRTTITPSCDRAAGDDGANPAGAGCSVADLCAEGWHVCVGGAEVAARSPGGCAESDPSTTSFFAVRQSGPGGASCGDGANDVFGCGSVGVAVTDASCAPLDRFSNDLCAALPAPWTCGPDGTAEADQVVKPGSDAGGVMCCRDGPL